MKCNYCDKETKYTVGWVFEDGYHENNACDDHLVLAKLKQESVIRLKELSERIKHLHS